MLPLASFCCCGADRRWRSFLFRDGLEQPGFSGNKNSLMMKSLYFFYIGNHFN